MDGWMDGTGHFRGDQHDGRKETEGPRAIDETSSNTAREVVVLTCALDEAARWMGGMALRRAALFVVVALTFLCSLDIDRLEEIWDPPAFWTYLLLR